MVDEQQSERTPPSRVRVSGLQEAQLQALEELDAACAAMYYAIGFDGAAVPVNRAADFAHLTREHTVHVAEADHVVAGYVAWRDEPPGVAYVAELAVHPDLQRFGVATKLLETVRGEARSARLTHLVARCWEKAPWAWGFYKKLGFAPIDAQAPARVQAWVAARAEGGRPLTRPGEQIVWAAVGSAWDDAPTTGGGGDD